MQAALAALATLGVTVTLDGDCGRTQLAATSPAPYNSATKCTKLKNIDNLESICDSSYYASGDDLIACLYNKQIEKCRDGDAFECTAVADSPPPSPSPSPPPEVVEPARSSRRLGLVLG